MFRYICMPKLVAFYLREFSVRSDGEPSDLYKFVFCLCLPFVSNTFRQARLVALAIAECTDSVEQIKRVLEKITDATVTFSSNNTSYFVAYDGSGDVADFSYDGSAGTDNPAVPFVENPFSIIITITPSLITREEIESYLSLLIPFYIEYKLIYA